ncbi:MAG: hypothetical protein K0S08_1707 [Gammaproteobacteria bacterium]|jgi:hypothetical protein|nr:hypothetical protein [Gammaproteobacteria bacterium]
MPLYNFEKMNHIHQMVRGFIAEKGRYEGSLCCFFQAGSYKTWAIQLDGAITRQAEQMASITSNFRVGDITLKTKDKFEVELTSIARKEMSAATYTAFLDSLRACWAQSTSANEQTPLLPTNTA